MTDRLAQAQATLDAWREQRADRMNTVRFHFMEALARRATHHEGEARCVLEDRLCGLIEAFASDLDKAALPDDTSQDDEPSRSALSALIDQINRHAQQGNGRAGTREALPALDEFQQIWSGIRTASQLQQSMQPSPENAGPLNAGTLVHRSMSLMRDLSPGYLQHFLAYVDDLSWLEQMNVPGPTLTNDAPAAAPRKRTRKKKAAATSADTPAEGRPESDG
ncbi:DUF2894 domain-containing protein [Dyella sp. C11]|uniref:DUF2894 domain-containing protein n=1 Tax=Dyella sp. C11 TaxID=2126991 RepID=UPI000D65CF15|nr:DUF2894 domain-containing protein [Dyella sp. C11]